MLTICPICDNTVDADIFHDNYGKEIETDIQCKECGYKERYSFKIRRIEYNKFKYLYNEQGDVYSNTHVPLKLLILTVRFYKRILKWLNKY